MNLRARLTFLALVALILSGCSGPPLSPVRLEYLSYETFPKYQNLTCQNTVVQVVSLQATNTTNHTYNIQPRYWKIIWEKNYGNYPSGISDAPNALGIGTSATAKIKLYFCDRDHEGLKPVEIALYDRDSKNPEAVPIGDVVLG